MFELVMTDGRRPSTPPVAVSNTSTLANRTGSWKYIRPAYHDRVAPCNAACPVGVDVAGYMALLREGRIDEAADLLMREHPLPSVTGRVCNHPCEDLCNRGGFDGAVAIHAVERMLGDRVLARPLPEREPVLHAERVGVVGSGPAGLSCAYHLARLGYAVEILEAADAAGGMLRQGIPPYRLPREVLDRQIARIEALGPRLRLGTVVGRDVSWEELQRSYDAVFFATGARVGRPLGVSGEDGPGVRQGLDFLEAANRGEPVEVGRRVVVVGGGNTAMDCARTAVRLGAEVTVAYRRTREEMPAIAHEIEEAEREGVKFDFLAAPLAFNSEGGRLRFAAFQPMRLGEPDESGRRRPEPTEDEPFAISADTVLLATGEEVELTLFPKEVLGRGEVTVDEWGATRVPALFAGGDAAGEERTVARAIGAGKRAALGIDRRFRAKRGEADPVGDPATLRLGGTGNMSATRWRGDDPVRRVDPLDEVVPFADLNLAHFEPSPRHAEHFLPLDASRSGFAETNLGLASDEALAEAGRCFDCGLCNECELCLIFCGDAAITRGADGRFDISLEHCKGCGVCAVECPRGAITMTREGL